jgi:uncharacterized repeat protein (TIGR01451 family)
VGSSLTYTITVTNSGPGAAAALRLTDAVLGSANLVSATPTQGNCTTISFLGELDVSCELGSLASAAKATLSVVVTPTAEGTIITSMARVSSNLSDPNALNNSVSESTTVTPTADLSITKTDGQTAAVTGTPITYTIVASNAGPSNVFGATVADTLPATITGATWTCVGDGGAFCAANGSGSINDTVDLPVGGTVTYTLTGTISALATGSLSNTATVAAPGGVPDPNLANNTATDTDMLTVGQNYFTIAPCRLVDTRGGAPIGGPVLQGQQTRTLAVAAKCGIPLTAKAISINLVVTQASAAGNLRLFPAGQPVPTASSINYGAGQTRANNAVIRLNASGAMAAFVGQAAGTTVHLILDVNGYFE